MLQAELNDDEDDGEQWATTTRTVNINDYQSSKCNSGSASQLATH